MTNFLQRSMGISPEEKQLSISGHNWGGVEIDGQLSFLLYSTIFCTRSIPFL
jgi:structure-specific recognition protein 1